MLKNLNNKGKENLFVDVGKNMQTRQYYGTTAFVSSKITFCQIF